MNEPYDLIIIGAGSAGLTAVEFGVKLGVKVALVEKARVGGDCTWTGCVPSKALLQVAKVAQSARTAGEFGIIIPPPQVDMAQVRDYVTNVIAAIYQHETPELLRESGVDFFLGAAQFLDKQSVRAGDQIIRGKKIIIATGARPSIPPIPGLEDVAYQTYEQFFNNDKLPDHLIVIGAGPTGVEMAQAYGRLGAQVTIIDEALLPREDPEVAAIMEPLLRREGVQFVPGLVESVSGEGDKFIVTAAGESYRSDMLLAATGRLPNVIGLNLEKAGVRYSERGIIVDNSLRTSARPIYAAGDVVQGSHQFTHFAGWQGFQAVRNALLPGNSPGFSEEVPRVFYTDPEIAHVGLAETAAREKFGDAIRIIRQDLDRVDRAVTDNAQSGFIKMIHKRNGRLLGATVVAPRAGEIISEFTLALKHGLKIRDLAELFHAYPSYAMGVQRPAAAAATDQVLSGNSGKLVRRLAGR